MPDLAVDIIPCLQDNYAYLVRLGGFCAVIDPAETAPVEAALQAGGWRLTHILNTHHHWDHSGGNRELKAHHGAEVVGPEKDRSRIPAIDTGVGEEKPWMFGAFPVEVLEVPAHTRGAVAYVLGGAVFAGDTLFAMGCGRLFEGDAAQMHASLAKLMTLPDETQVYCGHEYTLTNARFALSLEPDNAALQARIKEVEALRAVGFADCAVGDRSGTGRAHPFLRTHSAQIRASVGMTGADDIAVFAEIRRRKDVF